MSVQYYYTLALYWHFTHVLRFKYLCCQYKCAQTPVQQLPAGEYLNDLKDVSFGCSCHTVNVSKIWSWQQCQYTLAPYWHSSQVLSSSACVANRSESDHRFQCTSHPNKRSVNIWMNIICTIWAAGLWFKQHNDVSANFLWPFLILKTLYGISDILCNPLQNTGIMESPICDFLGKCCNMCSTF